MRACWGRQGGRQVEAGANVSLKVAAQAKGQSEMVKAEGS